MILKGAQRGGAKQLALHLLKAENEHVEVHELRGFLADDLLGALQEAQAVSRGTRCRQFLFSLSLNPPETENVPVPVFEAAIERIEDKLGLAGHPRAVVFHEKEGRRHAHCVWSRIDTGTMTAVNLPHFKLKLRDVSRELYLEHGWRMPRGLMNSRARDPLNFSRAEWQQARRVKEDPQAIKALFRECWAVARTRRDFAEALAARGYVLAQGDRRGFVAVDYRGEVYAVARWAGLRTKEVREKLGDPRDLPTVAATKAEIARCMSPALGRYLAEAQAAFQKGFAVLGFKRSERVQRHRAERERLDQAQQERWDAETNARAARLSHGFRGVWDRLTGRYARIRRQNEQETWQSARRDQAERDALVERQLEERRELQAEIRAARQAHARDVARLHRDIGHYLRMAGRDDETFAAAADELTRDRRGAKQPDRKPGKDRSTDIGLDLDM